MFEIPFASARAMTLDALKLLLPPERLSVPQHAAQKRLLDNAGGGHVGLIEHEKAPYTVKPSEELDSLDFMTVAVVGPGQVAKTVIAENWLLKSVDIDPANLLWYMQTDEGIESYVKGRINPMIELHDEILYQRLGKRSVDNSLHFKRFRGMWVEFLAASARTLINKSAPRIVADEIDNWMLLGDVKTLLDIRRQTYGIQSMLLALSHPDRAKGLNPETDWTSGIMSIYADSDRRVWYWPCPECGAWSSPVPIAARVMSLEYETDPEASLDDVQASAHLLCPVNGCKIPDHEREAMNIAAYRSPHGGWIGQGQTISEGGEVSGELVKRDTAGFWIVGPMSPFVIGGIGGLARARVKAEREFQVDGEDASLRQVVVKQWGVPYKRPRAQGSVEARDLVERSEDHLARGFVPEGVRFLAVAADIQANHFEYMVRGFGVGGESWIIDTGKILADPASEPSDWDKLLGLLFDGVAYPLTDGSGRAMLARAFGYDSQGQPGVTQQAREAWLRWRRQNKVRLYGKIGERPAYSVIPLRGNPTANAPRLQITFPDTGKAQNRTAGAGEVPIGQFNPNQFKSDLGGQLKRAEPGAWFVHLPAWLKSKGETHHWFEQLTSEHQLPNGAWDKIVSSARNEALDLMVMTHVVAHLHGVSRIKWETPPAWAAPWDSNSLVLPIDPGGAAIEGGGPPVVRVRAPLASGVAKATRLA